MSIPDMTVKAFAELQTVPVYQYVRILSGQKNPRQEPAVFRVPYYEHTRRAIERFYFASNDEHVIVVALQRAGRFSQPHKRRHNRRALQQFLQSKHVSRDCEIRTRATRRANLEGVRLRITDDIEIQEAGHRRHLFLHYGAAEVAPAQVKAFLTLGWHVIHSKRPKTDISQLEWIDLERGTTTILRRPQKRVLTAAEHTAKAVKALWPTL